MQNLCTAGIGLRMPHIVELLNHPSACPWLELLADNWLSGGGINAYYLDALAERFPLAVHGVGLSLASQSPLNLSYLNKIKQLLKRSQAIAYSEHLSFSQLGDQFLPDLLPVIYNETTLNHLMTRVNQVQDFLGISILIENVSSYLSHTDDSLTEAELLSELASATGCGILLDINNLYVNQVNLNRDALTAINALPVNVVKEIHLAGFQTHRLATTEQPSESLEFLVDAHNNPVAEAVWDLYKNAIDRFGAVPTLIEWDNEIPTLATLLAEQNKAQKILDSNHRRRSDLRQAYALGL